MVYRKRSSFRKGKKKLKKTIQRVIDQNLERYTLLSSIKDTTITSNALNSAMFVYSLTGGYHTGLEVAQQGVALDGGMRGLFTLQPLGGATSGGAGTVEGAGQGGLMTDFVSPTDTAPGTQMLRGTECKLLNFKANYCITSTSETFSYTVHVAVVETRRPLGDVQVALGGLSQQLWLQAHLRTLVGPQPDSHLAFFDYGTVQRVLYHKVHNMKKGAYNNNVLNRIHIKINKKAHWKYSYNRAPTDNALQYQGPFIYVVMWRDGGVVATSPPTISMSSMLSLQDA